MTSVLEFVDFRYNYPDGTKALDGLTCQFGSGETVGIVGPNGAGKTTALLAACGLLTGKGEVRIQGTVLTKKNTSDLRKHIGFVFQNPDDQLFMPTVYEDIAFGPKNLHYSDSRVEHAVHSALESVELTGYEEKSSHHLSTGEKKRVALATVLAMDPKVLILDEPSTNLDPHSRRQLISLIESMQISTIVAGHDLEMMLELCDRVLILDQGKVAAEGDPDELFSDEVLMEQNLLEIPYSLRQYTN